MKGVNNSNGVVYVNNVFMCRGLYYIFKSFPNRFLSNELNFELIKFFGNSHKFLVVKKLNEFNEIKE